MKKKKHSTAADSHPWPRKPGSAPFSQMNRWLNLIVIVLVFLAGTIFSAASSPWQERVIKKRPVDSFSAKLSAMPGAGGSVLYADGGRAVCRAATPEEALAMVIRNPNLKLHFITPPANAKQQMGLRIMLRSTQQLENFPQAKQAFIRAAQTWESLIDTRITLIVDVDFGPTRFGEPWPEGVLGSTSSQELFGEDEYPNVRTALIEGASTPEERSVFEALPGGQVPTDIGSTADVFAPSSVFRALGRIDPVADPDREMENFGPPPSIGFNSSFNWDFNPDDGVDFDKQNFVRTAVHEIGHALGFTSEAGLAELDSSVGVLVSVWDLYRFRPGTGANFSSAQRILSSGGTQVFFVGGPELQLSTGRPDGSGGDGQQSSHWKDDALTGEYIGVMDPTQADGEDKPITQNDLVALDVMGYTLKAGGPPPGGTVPLTSGTPVNGSIQDVNVLGETEYTIQVPSGATELKVDLSGNQDVDLFVRFGQRVTVENGQVVADFRSESFSGNESITITPSSSPPLQQGTYFIGVVNFGPGPASFTVTATVTGGGPPPDGNTVPLTSGQIVSGSISDVNVLGQTQYTIQVSAGASQLLVELSGNQDVDLFVRFGQRVAVQNGQVVADFSSESFGGDEQVVVSPFTTPPLQAGTYFIGVANFGPGPAQFDLRATVQ